MTNRRNKRRRLMRLEGEALIYGGHLAAGLHAMVKPLVGFFNSFDTFERVMRKSRARLARKNYRETGSATRWGTCPHTMWIHEPLVGTRLTVPLNSSPEPFDWDSL